MKTDILRTEIDKALQRKDFPDRRTFRYERETNKVPEKKKRLLCIIFSENKGAYFLYRKFDNTTDSFKFNKGVYIIENESIHIAKNGMRVCFYLEGISTPMSMKNVERCMEEVTFIDLEGQKQTMTIQKIKGLKYDSKILDTFTDRKLSENFTKIDEKFKYGLITMLLVIVTLISTIIGGAISYYY